MSVSVEPGETQFTRTWGANSKASCWLSAITAASVAE
jgi:hypothetical protein